MGAAAIECPRGVLFAKRRVDRKLEVVASMMVIVVVDTVVL